MRPLPWSLPLAADIRRDGVEAFLPMQRDHSVEGAQAVRAGDTGWLVAFRDRGALYAGWIAPDLTAIGALSLVGDETSEKGLPALAWNGREALLV